MELGWLRPKSFGWRTRASSIMVATELQARDKISKFNSLSQYFATSIPVIIPTFNAVTYAKSMVEQLKSFGMRNIIIADNNSTYQPMLNYLSKIQDEVKIVRLRENHGPRNVVIDQLNYSLLPDIFCLTDPDLVLNNNMPVDFLVELIDISISLKCGKVGLALEISDRELMIQKDFMNGKLQKIWEHEAQFWTNQIYETARGAPVYEAQVDTTFALYNKAFFKPAPLSMFLRAVRVGGDFTCRHLPWYLDNGLPPAEEVFYRATAKDSYYLKQNDEQRTRAEEEDEQVRFGV